MLPTTRMCASLPMPGRKSLRCAFHVSNRPKIARLAARVMLFRPFFSNVYIYHQLGLLLNTTYLAWKAQTIIFLRILLFSRQLWHPSAYYLMISLIYFFSPGMRPNIFFSWHEACEICWSSNIYWTYCRHESSPSSYFFLLCPPRIPSFFQPSTFLRLLILPGNTSEY